MRITVEAVYHISDEELIEAGVDISNDEDVIDYFYDFGGTHDFTATKENVEVTR